MIPHGTSSGGSYFGATPPRRGAWASPGATPASEPRTATAHTAAAERNAAHATAARLQSELIAARADSARVRAERAEALALHNAALVETPINRPGQTRGAAAA